MLSLRDTWVMATTKLRVRRVRLVVTLVVSGILFTVLIFGSLVIRGTVGSIQSFASEGFLNSYITSIMNANITSDTYRDKAFIARVEQLEKMRLAAQAAEAKRLGLAFDPKTISPAVSEINGPQGKEKIVNNEHPSARQALAEYAPDTLQATIEEAAKGYSPKAYYQSFRFAAAGAAELEFTPIVNNKEHVVLQAGAQYGLRDSLGTFQNDLTAVDNTLLKPFLLEGASLEAKPGEPIPVLAPIDAVEKMVGLTSLTKNAKPEERLTRLRDMRGKAKDLILETCYRNRTAMDLRTQALQQIEEIKLRSTEAGYVKPAVVYGEPASACVPTPIISDTRTTEEKALAAKQAAFDETFGSPKPVTQRVKFRVVGVLPQLGSLYSAQGPEALVSSFFTPSLGEGWFISREVAQQNPLTGPVVSDPYFIANGAKNLFVEFKDRESQKRFITNKSCDFSGENYMDCQKRGKFMAVPFGNPLATLGDAKKDFDKFLSFVLLVIAALSAIVMMGTIGKIIADSRKETSVFRAVGAKRMDIAQIYLLYTGILAVLSYLTALTIGVVAALLVESKYSSSLSVQAVLAFNSRDLDKTFHLIGFNMQDLSLILAFALAVGLASALVPLLANLRREPVKDMREE